MENPAKMSLTKEEIFSGSSKLPSVTAFTANLDCEQDVYQLELDTPWYVNVRLTSSFTTLMRP
jgi:hypothetical protein